MMSGAVFDHDGNSASQLLIEAFDRQCVVAVEGIEAPADVQQRYIALDQFSQPQQAFPCNQRIVGIDGRDLIGCVVAQVNALRPPPLMPTKAGLVDRPCRSVRNVNHASQCLISSD